MTSGDARDEIDYLGYTLGQQAVVSALGDIIALQACPMLITPVPGTKPWIQGLATISGDLLPIMDVPQWLGLSASATQSSAKLLVVERDGVRCGLMVTSVIGRMTGTVRSQAVTTESGQLQPYVSTVLHTDQAEWLVLELAVLLSDARLMTNCMDHPGLVG